MAAADGIRARAQASIANLGHGFDVLGLCVDAGCDVVEVSRGGKSWEICIAPAAAGALRPTSSECAAIPCEVSRNTAGAAVAALCRDHGISEPLRIRIEKGLRPGSGLGSSAASAAAAVTAANELFGLGLSRLGLIRYAAVGEGVSAGVTHADNVAAALCGGFVICEGRDGLEVQRLEPPGDLRLVIATPHVEVTTRAARAVLPERVTLAEYSRGCGRCAMIVAALLQGDWATFGRALEGSFVDQARGRLIPGYAAVVQAAKEAGALGVVICGSGPSLAAIPPPGMDSAGLATAMGDAFRAAGQDCTTQVVGVGSGATVI